MTDGNEARAARNSARSGPVAVSLGAERFEFVPEIPLDVALALNTLNAPTTLEARVWLEAHLEQGAECDTSCADEGFPILLRDCPSEASYRKRIKKARRTDGGRVSEAEFADFHDAILDAYAVTEGESQSSGGSPATPGDSSSGTASENAST